MNKLGEPFLVVSNFSAENGISMSYAGEINSEFEVPSYVSRRGLNVTLFNSQSSCWKFSSNVSVIFPPPLIEYNLGDSPFWFELNCNFNRSEV